MTFNYGLEKKKFDKAWTALRKAYLEAGMEPEAVEEMYQFDWNAFKSARVEALHTQEMEIPEDAEEMESPLLKKFMEQFTASYDSFGSHSRYWWLEELNNPCLAIGLGKLSEDDKEILTLYIVDGMTESEIAKLRNTYQMDISRRLARIFSFFK